jgi:hypothetical protein
MPCAMIAALAFRTDHRRGNGDMPERDPVTVLLVGPRRRGTWPPSASRGWDSTFAAAQRSRAGAGSTPSRARAGTQRAVETVPPCEPGLEPTPRWWSSRTRPARPNGASRCTQAWKINLVRDDPCSDRFCRARSATSRSHPYRNARPELATNDEATALPTQPSRVRVGRSPSTILRMLIARRGVISVRSDRRSTKRSPRGARQRGSLTSSPAPADWAELRSATGCSGQDRPDTFCILLDRESEGAETTVLSRCWWRRWPCTTRDAHPPPWP